MSSSGKQYATKWYVLQGSKRDGAYKSKAVAESYMTESSQIVTKTSLNAARKFLGHAKIVVYNETVAATPPAAKIGETSASDMIFYAVKGGSRDGVYTTIGDVL